MSKKILTALGYIAVLLLLAGVIAFIAVFTRGFTSEFATFYVVHASENIFAESDTKTLTADTELRFDVKYTFGDLADEESGDFTATIVPYITDDTYFAYLLDGEERSFDDEAETDFSAYFGLVKYDGYFTINIPYGADMTACLQSVHEGMTVTVDETVDITALPYFALKVVSYNGESTVLIPFVVYKSADGIVITPDEIII